MPPQLPLSLALPILRHPESGAFRQFVEALGETGRFFMVEGIPCMLSGDGSKTIPLDKAADAGGSVLHARCVYVTNEEDIHQPAQAIRQELGAALTDVLRSEPRLWPAVDTVVHGPAFAICGDGIDELVEGFNPVSRSVILGSGLPAVLPEPAEGFPHLHALFGGLLFADEVMHANLLGTLCAMFARTALREFPILILDAAQKSSGKTVTASTLGYLLTGREQAPITYSGNEHEFEVRLGDFAHLPGPHVIHIDNVRAKTGQISRIRSQALSAAVHRHCIKTRKLHEGLAPLFDPIFLFTMNGARVEGDLADKVVTLSLRRPPGADIHRKIMPWPMDYARAHRLEILAEIFSILRGLKLDGLDVSVQHTRFYHFEQIMIKSSKVLGLEASLDPARVRTADVCVVELLHLIGDELPVECAAGRVPIKALADKLEASPGVKELNEILSSASRSQKGKREAFRDYLLNALDQHTYRHRDQVVTLVVDNEDLLLKR
jgi:hypothetical protein